MIKNLNENQLYYLRKIKKLNFGGEFNPSLVFYDGEGNKTNSMNLNRDSLPVFIYTLMALLNTMKGNENE